MTRFIWLFPVKVDVNEVDDEWRKESGPSHIRRVAEHYGIFDQMFDGAHFHATVPLNVWFDYDDEFVTPVKYGNVIPAQEVRCSTFHNLILPCGLLFSELRLIQININVKITLGSVVGKK